MSNVLERYRNVSSMEFHRNAVWLRDEMERFCMREKNVPRRYRAIITYPLVEAFDTLLNLIEEANLIYTDTEEKLRERKEVQAQAIRQVSRIYGILQHAAGLLSSFSVTTETDFCAPTTKVFAEIEWAQIGVKIRASASGSTIGPPADIE